MPAAAELQPPAAYDDRWLLLCAAAVAAVAAYYLAVWWWTRPRRPRQPDRGLPRERCLAELDRIEAAAARGELAPREAHQQVSRTVRELAETTRGIPARSMTLGALRRSGPEPLADLVAVLYPPAFSSDDERGRRELAETLDRARALVRGW